MATKGSVARSCNQEWPHPVAERPGPSQDTLAIFNDIDLGAPRGGPPVCFTSASLRHPTTFQTACPKWVWKLHPGVFLGTRLRTAPSPKGGCLEAGELAELHFTLANVIQSTSFHNMSYQFEKKLATSPGPTFRTCPHPPKGKGLRLTVQPVNYAPYIPMRLVRVPAVAKKVAA